MHSQQKENDMKTSKCTVAAMATYLSFCFSAHATTIYWQDSFETGDFSGWSVVQGIDPAEGGPGPQYVYVTNQAQSGIPPQNGTYFAHFERPASAVNYPDAKIYKEWSNIPKRDWLGRQDAPIFDSGNVSGTYSAWFYFPVGYTVTSDWVNIFQFKEDGNMVKGGPAVQNPSWWLNVGPQTSFANGNPALETYTPILFVNYWGNNYQNYHPATMPVPLGKWFNVTALLVSGNRIVWYIDGQLLDNSYNSTYPVGRFYYNSTGWVFGVGHYYGVGTDYVDHVVVSNLPWHN
jgi:hypothetical protein